MNPIYIKIHGATIKIMSVQFLCHIYTISLMLRCNYVKKHKGGLNTNLRFLSSGVVVKCFRETRSPITLLLTLKNKIDLNDSSQLLPIFSRKMVAVFERNASLDKICIYFPIWNPIWNLYMLFIAQSCVTADVVIIVIKCLGIFKLRLQLRR